MATLEKTIANIEPLRLDPDGSIQRRLDSLTKPPGSLGELEAIAKRIASIKKILRPKLERKLIFTMAADHGVAGEGVSAYPREVTAQMVANFLAGGAAINVLARHVGADVVVVDCGVAAELPDHPSLVKAKVAPGTANIAAGPAMTRAQAVRSIEAGIRAFDGCARGQADVVGVGDMGIGNTTPSAAIASVLTGLAPEKVTGRGTGVEGAAYEKKIDVVRRALRVNRPSPDDPVDILAKVGGFEIGGIAGVCLAGAAAGVPVVVDGFISTAGAAIAAGLAPEAKGYLFASHVSVEIGHAALLGRLGLAPIFRLGMRLGEGTGAALAIGVMDAAVKILDQMATFGEAGVSEKDP